MNSTPISSSPTEEVIFPTAYSFGGFVQFRTTTSVKVPEAVPVSHGEIFQSNEGASVETPDLLPTERTHAETR